MRLNTIIQRYLLREMFPPFLITLVFITFVFLMTTLLEITNLVVNYRIRLSTVGLMVVYSMPYFLEYIIPMSVMMAILLAILRLSGDNEIVALKACGMNIYGLLPPVLLFALLGCLATGFVAIHALPWGKSAFKKTLRELAASNFEVGLKERTFNDDFNGVMLYVSRIDPKTKTLIDVFIEDQRSGNMVSTVIAPRGLLESDPEKLAGHLRLFDGSINNVDLKSKSAHAIYFDTYDVHLDIRQAVARTKRRIKDRREMTLSELRDYLRRGDSKMSRYYAALIEYHKKFSIPFACFALALLAVPLGLQSSASRRSYGLVLVLFFFFFYYSVSYTHLTLPTN